jgi:hypothetical protein
MKRLVPLLFLFAAPAHADLMHSITTSTQLNVNAAATQAERIGSSFSISGNNVDTTDGTTASTVSVGTITSGVYAPGTIAATQDTAGAAFSFSQSYTQADAIPTSAPTVGTVGNFGSVTSTAAGAKDTLAGTITSAGVVTITAGGAGTSAIGSVVTEVTVR